VIFQIDLGSNVSVYRQICDQAKYAVATGALAPGDRLPAIRELAAQTRVNRNTVARAYLELEREGVIVSRAGQGSFVSDGVSAIQKRERLRVLEDIVRNLLVQAYHFQIPPEEVRALLEREQARLEKERER